MKATNKQIIARTRNWALCMICGIIQNLINIYFRHCYVLNQAEKVRISNVICELYTLRMMWNKTNTSKMNAVPIPVNNNHLYDTIVTKVADNLYGVNWNDRSRMYFIDAQTSWLHDRELELAEPFIEKYEKLTGSKFIPIFHKYVYDKAKKYKEASRRATT